MPLVIENGTVVAGADSYASEAELVAYASARGTTLTEDTARPLLVRAMERLAGLPFIGERYSRDQALDWPRHGVCIDGFAYLPTELPAPLKAAQLAMAFAANSIDLMPPAAAGASGAVVEDTVGPITTRYAEGVVRTVAKVPAADAQLAKILKARGALAVVRA